MRRALVVLALPVACGGSIAPVDTFNDPPIDSKADAWQRLDFATETKPYSECAGGARYVRPVASYDLWVGVELCSASRYKIFLARARLGPYAELASLQGRGEDACELVNPKLTSADDRQVATGSLVDASKIGKSAFVRSRFGEAFSYERWPADAVTATWYECGVALP